jgi:hypothetical protein
LYQSLQFSLDVSDLASSIQEIARNLAASTPDDPQLQTQAVALFRAHDRKIRSAAWIDLNFVLIETLLAFVHAAEEDCVYVGQITKAAEVILSHRGENRTLEPREVGPRLDALGLITEMRNSKGIRLILTGEVSRRVHELAHMFSVPLITKGSKSCKQCN